MAEESPDPTALQCFGAMVGFALMFVASVFLLQIFPIRLFIAGIVFGAVGTVASAALTIMTLAQGARGRSDKPSGDGVSAMASLFNNMSEQGAGKFAKMLNEATPVDVKNLADRLNAANETDVQAM